MSQERLIAIAATQKTDMMVKELMAVEATKPVLKRLKKMEEKLVTNIKAAGDPGAGVMASAYARLDTLRMLIKQIEESNAAIEASVEDYVLVN